MRGFVEAAVRPPEAVLLTDLALRTTVAIDTVGIVAVQTKVARGHASDGLEDDTFVLSYFIAMVMVAVYIGTFAKQEV